MRYLRQVGVFVLFIQLSGIVFADETAQKKKKILGREVSVAQQLKTISQTSEQASENGAETVSHINLFGKKVEILKNSVRYNVNDAGDLSYKNQFYVNGRKILAESLDKTEGALIYAAEVPATEISGDLFRYSLGLVTLAVSTGMNYEGSLQASVESDFLRPVPPVDPTAINLINASAEVDVLAKGFIEGQARILFFTGAVGGAVDLIEGAASASISSTPATMMHPEVSYDGAVNLLGGHFYGYLGSGFFRWFQYDFFKSKGSCFSFGEGQCHE